jgi:hypothetical protein
MRVVHSQDPPLAALQTMMMVAFDEVRVTAVITFWTGRGDFGFLFESVPTSDW